MESITGETEGVIKYRLQHRQAALDASVNTTTINAWRDIMHRLRLIGQDACRYDGLGYGNISLRLQQPSGEFLVSGTQTGHLAHLQRDEYCIVLAADARHNSLNSVGPCRPSSEALTHAVIYRQLPEVTCVIHVHSPEIWHFGECLQLPATAADIRYGTPEMATAVEQLIATPHCLDKGVFTMRGHQDGVVAFGVSPQQAAQRLIAILAEALAIAETSAAS